MLDDLICNVEKNISDVLEVIDKNGRGIAFIVDMDRKFVGTLSDGDIRRAILAKLPLNMPIKKLLNRETEEFKKIIKFYPDNIAKKLLRPSVWADFKTSTPELVALCDDRISVIPLLDKGTIVDFFEHKSVFRAPIASPFMNGNELKYVIECMDTNWISSQGRFVSVFEDSFSNYCNQKFGVSVSNGTVAIHLALSTLNIGKGDEVIVPDLTFGATINAVLHANATPVIIDVEEDSWGINPECIKKVINSKTKAIIPVHLYGKPANMMEIKKIADEYGLYVIEDCAEAIGAEIDSNRVGSFSDISCFSFFGNKIITTGEGGMCLTDSEILDEKMRVLRDHGMSRNRRYWHEMVGMNYRMTNLQAAIGVAQLENLESYLEKRDQIQDMYDNALSEVDILEKRIKIKNVRTVNWLVTFLLAKGALGQERIIDLGKSYNIDIRPFFYPLSDMKIFEPYKGMETPVAHDLSKRGICLPTSLDFDSGVYTEIVDKIKKILMEASS